MMQEPLTASQARLQEDLRGLIYGDARCDDVIRQLYSSDGSPFEERPRAVVWPKTAQDVSAVVQYAVEKGLSVHSRGSGTSGSAASIGSGIILDFSRHMKRALQAGDDYVRAQPGAVRERVNELLRRSHGAFFAPSSGHVPTGTIGSILSVDNIGPRWLRYGSPHESVRELKVVLADGSQWALKNYPAAADALPTAWRALAPENAEHAFRAQFLNVVAAETQGVDPLLELRQSGKGPDSPDALLCGLDFDNGYGIRSFRSDFVRNEYFLRVFGDGAHELRSLIKKEPWRSALLALRDAMPYLDAEQRRSRPCRCGYALRDVVRFGFNPTRFFTGSEGTLGIITEATLATFETPPASAATILLFDSIDRAVRAVPRVLDFDPTLCDLLDSRVVALTREWDSRFEETFPQGTEAALVVELDADSSDVLRSKMEILQHVARKELGSFGRWLAYAPEERGIFRELLQKSSCARLRVAPSFQIFPYWDDVQVPVDKAADFLSDVHALLKRAELVYSVSGHIGNGQLSIQPLLPYDVEEERRALALSDEFENLALSYGGEIGSARGNGRVRTASLTKRFPKLSRAFVNVKDAFDPCNTLNPDCVVSPEMRRLVREDRLFSDAHVAATPRQDASPPVGAPEEDDDILAPESDAALRESSLHSRNVKRRAPYVKGATEIGAWKTQAAARRADPLEYQLAWDPELVSAPARQCTGCGRCRIRTPETRLCPAFRHMPEEDASCRGKANLIRGVLDGALPLTTMTRGVALEIGRHCLRCRLCLTECPAQVDASRLAFRIRSAYVAAAGMSFSELCVSRVDLLLSAASLVAPLVNQALRNKLVRRIIERALGLAYARRLVPLAARSQTNAVLKRGQDSRKLVVALAQTQASIEAPAVATRKARKVALFADVYERRFDPELLESALAILEKNRIQARILPTPRSAGQTSFALGDLDRAEHFAVKNIAAFREAMRDGSTIVALEPSAAACVVKDYPYFCDDPDAQAVYGNIVDFCGYLARLDALSELNRDDLQPIPEVKTIGYHAPCAALALSGKATSSATNAQTLLGLIPGVEIHRLERGCCGFACFAGFSRKRYYESLQLGGRLFLAARRRELQLCSSECSFCALQLAQGTTRKRISGPPVVHTIKALAVSYGLLSKESAVTTTYSPEDFEE